MSVTLAELRSEYRVVSVGPKIRERVTTLVEQQLKRRNPQIYARGSHDYRDGLDDVLHDFVIDVLLGEGQLDYFFKKSVSLEDFDRLTNRQLRHYLARTRQRTIVDNLLERAVKLLRADDLVEIIDAGGERFTRHQFVIGDAPADSLIRNAAAVAANAVPKIYSNPDERLPKVYSDKDLATLLRIFLGEIGCSVSRQDLQKLFDILLTPWIATLLGLDEAVNERPKAIEPGDEVVVDELAAKIATAWSEQDVIVFRYRLANKSDTHLAERLGVSRPTAANAKNGVYERLRGELADLDEHLRPELLARLASATDGVIL